ncbi:MAG: FAD-dependent oxidoreductase [Pseudomonadota bacterium]
MARPTHDVLVIGAGIVGAACALALQREGLDVGLVDAATPGAGVTAAGMGHLVALDESADELALCLRSLQLWERFMDAHPDVGEPSRCGTLWVAEDAHQLAEARQRAERLCRHGRSAEALTGDQLQRLEPALRRGLCGGVRVAGDSVVYPPAVAQFLARQARAGGATLYLGRRVVALGAGVATLADGVRLGAGQIVLAAGAEMAALLPEVPVFGRKGHLAITERYPGRLAHQVVSMNYGQSAAGADALAVAANVQPRPTGQWLVGSCRQDGQSDTRLDPSVLARMLRSAIALLPELGQMQIVRAWTGMRPATPDGRPLIGPHPWREHLWLAGGHEGLGVTTSFASAELLADQLMGRGGALDGAPYLPARFESMRSERHGN